MPAAFLIHGRHQKLKRFCELKDSSNLSAIVLKETASLPISSLDLYFTLWFRSEWLRSSVALVFA